MSNYDSATEGAESGSETLKTRVKARLRQRQARTHARLQRIDRRASDPPVLSYAQQRLWLLDQLLGGHHAYNMSLAIELQGTVDIESLRRSLELIAERHEVLRLRVGNHEGQPKVWLQEPQILSLPVQNVADDAEVQAIWRSERQYVFKLAEESLIRLRLLAAEGHRHVLIITMHHIISDGWSLGVLFDELFRSYRQLSCGQAHGLKPLPIQYGDYAHWQKLHLQETVLRSQGEYWRRQLRNLPPSLELPVDFPRSADPSYQGASVFLHIPRELLERAQRLASEVDATLFMTLLTAFSVLLHRRCGQDDFAIGTPVANRARSETENLIGCFVNLVVLRCELQGRPSFQEALQRTREMTVQAYAHQEVPFEYVVEMLRPDRDVNRTPLFQVMFALQNTPTEAVALDGIRMQPLIPDSNEAVARFDLTLNLTETPAGLVGVMEYRSDLFTSETIEQLMAQYLRLLEQMVERPWQSIDQYELAGSWDRRPYLEERAQKPPFDSLLSYVSALPSSQVVRIDEDGEHSRESVMRQADALAHVLAEAGACADECIGIVSHDNVHTLVALLAVHMLGATAYFLTPGTNIRRQRYLCKSAGIARVLACNSNAIDGTQTFDLLKILASASVERPTRRPFPEQRGAALRFHLRHAGGKLCMAQIGHQRLLQGLLDGIDTHDAPESAEWIEDIGLDAGIAALLRKRPRGQSLQSKTPRSKASGQVEGFRSFLPLVLLEGPLLAPLATVGEVCVAEVTALDDGADGLSAGHPLFEGERLMRTGYRAAMRPDLRCRRVKSPNLAGPRDARRLAQNTEGLLQAMYGSTAIAMLPHLNQWTVATHSGSGLKDEELPQILRRLKQSAVATVLPAAVIELQVWPTVADELDREALERVVLERAAERGVAEYAAPEGSTEETLAGIWSQLLEGRRVGRTDNFFMLGGYSLLAAQLVGRIRDAFGIEVSLREIFDEQVLHSQARLIERKRDGSDARLPPIELVERGGELELSYAQQRLWFLHRMMRANAVYNIPVALRLSGAVDEERLVWSLRRIVQRHEALRTRFAEVDGRAVQLIDAPDDGCVVVEAVHSEEELRQRYVAERNHCFDLSAESLCRLRVVRTHYDRQYVLLATFHHIVADGWSMGLFFKELAHLYRGAVSGEGAALEPLGIQYADYARWQRAQLSAEALEEQHQYWQRQLSGLPPLLELPSDYPRPAEQRYRGRSVRVPLSAQWVQGLQSLNRACGTTLFMSLIGGFAVLLGRYARQQDVAIGTPIANRPHPQTEQLIGFFLNSLVMRFDLSGNPSFRQVLERTKQMALQAYAHQSIPFEHLVERLNPVRSLSHAPLFQVSCSLVNTPVRGMGFGAMRVEELEFAQEEGVSRYDLTFNFSLLEDGAVMGTLEYNSDLFAASTIERMAVHYERLLEEMVRQPDLGVGAVEFLTDQERHRQLVQWNETGGEYPQCAVHELFAQQARSRPEAIAIVQGPWHLSYGELERRANQVAHYLLSQGVVADECVGLCVERSVEMVVGMLGILKAGGAYVPLDPGYPPSRLQQMLASSACRVILSEEHLLQELSFLSEYVTLPLDGRWHERLLGGYAASAPAVRVGADHLAYVIFTSGSTGVPKGVLISHASIVNLVCSASAVEVEQTSVVGQAASYAFDAITYELWGPLLQGARVVMIDKQTLLSPSALQGCLQQQQVGRLFITTALFNLISQQAPQAFACLDQVLFGGEAYSAQAIAQVLRAGAPRQLLHVYGPTESTTFATSFTLEAAQFLSDAQAPIGRPLTNITAYVMHGEQLAPLGAIGELCLGGAGLARGYLGDARLTARKFVPHSFGTAGERLYRTGDLVRARSDGALQFVGRVDEQVKVRGFRIELGEIEQALQAHAQVDQVRVLVREDHPGERRLVAYVIPQQGAERASLAAQWLQHLQGRIPEYALPSAFVMLDALPLNANGKLESARLPAPDASAYAHAQYVAPSTEVQVRLAALWQSNLARQAPIGMHDNYFAIGGDSIRSISLAAEARKSGLHFAIRDLFANPTIATLASCVRLGEEESAEPAALAPFALLSESEKAQLPTHHKGQAVEDAYPLSMLQQGMWFHSLQHPDLAMYHCVITFAVREEWQQECFLRALDTIIQRHPMMRMEFYSEGERPLQLVTAYRTPAVKVHDFRDQPDHSKQSLIEAWAVTEKSNALSPDELWRMGILLFNGNHIQCGLSFHHALWDGWSDATLVSELFASYRALLRDQATALPPPPPAYHHYIALEQQALGNSEHREYWARALAEVRTPWWARAGKNSGTHFFCDITAEMSADVLALTEALKVQEKSVWCAVYLVLNWMLAGDSRVAGSVVTHCRPEMPGAERTVGLFLNSLPLRADPCGHTWAAFIVRVNEILGELQLHRHYPLAQIQVDLRRDFSASLFAFVNFHVLGQATQDSNIVGGGNVGFDETNYLFSVHVQKSDVARRHVFRVTVDEGVFGEEFRERIKEYVANITAQMTRDPKMKVDKVRLLGGEYARLLHIGSGGRLATGADTVLTASAKSLRGPLIHELFEAQVEKTPEAIAAVFGSQVLTYAELNGKANQLAHYLRARGIGPDQLVAICVERSLEMVIGLLGILKAGGAYVPLDPSYPRERLEYMLKDAAPGVLLTQESLKSSLPGSAATLILLDSQWSEIAQQPTRDVNAADLGLNREHLAYVIYTSGSTGRPKGAMNEHGAVVNRLQWMQQAYELTPNDRVLQKTPFSFDVSVWEFFWTLLNGACLVVARPQGHQDPEYLSELIRKEGITTAHFVPSMLQVFLEHDEAPGSSRLRQVICSGEALSVELQNSCLERLPQAKLHNLYGPTEAAIDVTYWECRAEPGQNRVPLGRPISNTQIYILDSHLEPVPIGVEGEIHIGGVGVARGYLHRARLTAERFVADPFQPGGARMYRTGDLGRWRPDGHLEYLGRNDDQVKIRGFRIELGEIEARLSRHPQLKDVVVTAREDSPGQKRLVAYFTVRDEQAPAVEDLRAYLQADLPEYMVPAAFVMLASVPLTPNGKVDRAALPAPARSGFGLEAYEPPQGEIEEALAGVWQQLLQIEKIGRNDNFFELGGHSLLAMQSSMLMRKTYGLELNVRDYFEAPTIAGLGKRISMKPVAGDDNYEEGVI